MPSDTKLGCHRVQVLNRIGHADEVPSIVAVGLHGFSWLPQSETQSDLSKICSKHRLDGLLGGYVRIFALEH